MDTSTQDATGPPGFLRKLYLGWLEVAARFGEAQTLVLLFFVYAAVMGPMAIGAGLARRDFLHKRGLGAAGSAWDEADTVSSPDRERAKRMF